MNTQYDDLHIILSESYDSKIDFIGAFPSEEDAIRCYKLHTEKKVKDKGEYDRSLYTFKNMRTGEIKVSIPHLMDSKQLTKSLQDLHAAPFMNEALDSVLLIVKNMGFSNANII